MCEPSTDGGLASSELDVSKLLWKNAEANGVVRIQIDGSNLSYLRGGEKPEG